MSQPNELTTAERQKVCVGQLCPACKKTDIKHIGSAPDGFNCNDQYRCTACRTEWEGY